MNKGAASFLIAVSSAVAGGIACITGISAAFSNAGTWADNLIGFGIALLAIGGCLNLAVTVYGSILYCRSGYLYWWYIFSVSITLTLALGSLFAISLLPF